MDLIGIAHRSSALAHRGGKAAQPIYRTRLHSRKAGGIPGALETIAAPRADSSCSCVRCASATRTHQDFFYSLSDQSLQRRFMSVRRDVPTRAAEVRRDRLHEADGDLACVTRTRSRRSSASAVRKWEDKTCDIAFAVRDDYQGRDRKELIEYITCLPRTRACRIHGRCAGRQQADASSFDKMDYKVEKKIEEGVYEYTITFGAGNGKK